MPDYKERLSVEKIPGFGGILFQPIVGYISTLYKSASVAWHGAYLLGTGVLKEKAKRNIDIINLHKKKSELYLKYQLRNKRFYILKNQSSNLIRDGENLVSIFLYISLCSLTDRPPYKN